MVNRQYARLKTKHSNLFRTIKLFILLMLICGILIFTCITPIMLKNADYMGKIIVTKILSDTINDTLSDKSIDYSQISKIVRDKDNNITSIDTNMKAVNKIKLLISKNFTVKINSSAIESSKIPIGNLLANPLFLGRGPSIRMDINPIGYLNSQLKNEFTSAGINQTNHKIILCITADYTLTLPLHRSKTTLKTDFIIADTIIVGEIPEYYTNIAGENSDNASNIKTVYPNFSDK